MTAMSAVNRRGEMDIIVDYYFDFGLMWRRGRQGPRRLLVHAQALDPVSGVLVPRLGPGPRPAAPAPGARPGPGPLADDRATSTSSAASRCCSILLIVFGASGRLDPGRASIPREIGIPRWFGQPTPFWYGVIALTITYGAYMAEVYRAGIEAVPHGQMEAARSLGMSHAPVDALRDRPPGRPQGDPSAAQRLHRADEGHLAGQRDRRCSRWSRSGGTSRRRVQRLGAVARGASLPRS